MYFAMTRVKTSTVGFPKITCIVLATTKAERNSVITKPHGTFSRSGKVLLRSFRVRFEAVGFGICNCGGKSFGGKISEVYMQEVVCKLTSFHLVAKYLPMYGGIMNAEIPVESSYFYIPLCEISLGNRISSEIPWIYFPSCNPGLFRA